MTDDELVTPAEIKEAVKQTLDRLLSQSNVIRRKATGPTNDVSSRVEMICHQAHIHDHDKEG